MTSGWRRVTAAEGDARALETLFRRHVEATYAFARRFLDAREDAEEAASETWLRAGRALRAGGFGAKAASRPGCWASPDWSAWSACASRASPPCRCPADGNGPGRLGAVLARAGPGLGFGRSPGSLSEDHRLVLTLCDLQGLTAAEAAADSRPDARRDEIPARPRPPRPAGRTYESRCGRNNDAELDLGAIDWKSLEHAYGPADDVPVDFEGAG